MSDSMQGKLHGLFDTDGFEELVERPHVEIEKPRNGVGIAERNAREGGARFSSKFEQLERTIADGSTAQQDSLRERQGLRIVHAGSQPPEFLAVGVLRRQGIENG